MSNSTTILCALRSAEARSNASLAGGGYAVSVDSLLEHHLLGRSRALALDRDERPWGNYVVLDEGPDYKVKTITVFPGKRISYQRIRGGRSTGSSSTEQVS